MKSSNDDSTSNSSDSNSEASAKASPKGRKPASKKAPRKGKPKAPPTPRPLKAKKAPKPKKRNREEEPVPVAPVRARSPPPVMVSCDVCDPGGRLAKPLLPAPACGSLAPNGMPICVRCFAHLEPQQRAGCAKSTLQKKKIDASAPARRVIIEGIQQQQDVVVPLPASTSPSEKKGDKETSTTVADILKRMNGNASVGNLR